MTNEPNSIQGVGAVPERSAMVAVAHVVVHATIWLACFLVVAAITQVSRAELAEAALPLDPLSFHYLRFANAVGASPPLVLLGLGLALATIDLAAVYALGGRSRIAQVTRMLWSTVMTALPLIALGWALFALDLPFRAMTLSLSRVFDQYRQVRSHVKSQLLGTWVVTQLKKAGEAEQLPPRPLTITFSAIKGTDSDLRAESSDPSILLSGGATVSYQGHGVCLHLDDGKQADGRLTGAKQLCLAPREPGDRMILWVAPPGTPADDHQPTDRVTVLTLERRKGP